MDIGWIVVVVIVFGLGILWQIKKSSPKKISPIRRGYSSAGLGQQDFRHQWQRIESLMQQAGLENSKSAIFEADKLLDAALRQRGFRGDTVGERLKNARDHFGNNVVYQGLWEAHKMRNAMAHELGFDLPKTIAQQQLEKFKAGLQYLKVL